MRVRLQKILAEAGIASRRKAEEIIQAGCVTVNGVPVTELGAKADPAADTIAYNGKKITKGQPKIYIMMHKPEGVVTTATDPEGRKTVLDLLPKISARLYPVGRLDYDSSGLLLLTNDGGLTQRLTHPRTGIKKTYHVTVKGIPSPSALRKFAGGLFIEGKRTAACEVSLVRRMDNDALLQVIIGEGRNRQIRKMCAAIGHPVIKLKRIALGTLRLKDLPKGEWRYLNEQEVKQLGDVRI